MDPHLILTGPHPTLNPTFPHPHAHPHPHPSFKAVQSQLQVSRATARSLSPATRSVSIRLQNANLTRCLPSDGSRKNDDPGTVATPGPPSPLPPRVSHFAYVTSSLSDSSLKSARM